MCRGNGFQVKQTMPVTERFCDAPFMYRKRSGEMNGRPKQMRVVMDSQRFDSCRRRTSRPAAYSPRVHR